MSEQRQGTRAETASCDCKLGRAIDTYGLPEFNERLRDRRAEGASLRRLETVVNTAILRRALTSADREVIGDPGSIYETLTGEDVSAGERTAAAERLTRAGVDVEALREDFVSYQTVRTHLKECLDVDTARSEPLSPEDAQGTIQWARSRSEGIVERTLERLEDSEGFEAGDIDVSHVVRVSCERCGASHPVETFVDRGGCDCAEGATDA